MRRERARHPESLAPSLSFPSPHSLWTIVPLVHSTSPSLLPPSLSFFHLFLRVGIIERPREKREREGAAFILSRKVHRGGGSTCTTLPKYRWNGMVSVLPFPSPFPFHCQRKWSLEMSGGRDEKRTQKGVHGALFLSLLFTPLRIAMLMPGC